MNVKEALKTILDRIDLLPTEELGLLDSLGRVTAETISSGTDLPPWDHSSMDGFALRSRDTSDLPAVLIVVDESAAGSGANRGVGPFEAIRIMTGAPLPDGSDAVVKIEDVKILDDDRIRLTAGIGVGENVRNRGEDVAAGEVVIEERCAIGAPEIAMCAAVGRGRVRVFQKPRVAILATGDEIVAPGIIPGPHQIPDVNSHALAAQVISAGAVPIHLGISRDDPKDLRNRLEAGLVGDLVLISGGVSVGKYDYVKDVLAAMGFTTSFWKVAMKPGHPLLFGELGGRRVFGLPGNPVSALVTFEEFVRPALLKMAGFRELYRPTVEAIADEPFERKRDRKMHFVKVTLREDRGTFRVRSSGNQSSGAIRSLVRAEGLMVIPEDADGIGAGQTVTVQRLGRGPDRQATPGF